MSIKRNKVLVISGPTATGKTNLGIKLAKKLSNPSKVSIVNFDSLLFYREITIGSCKPTLEERGGIPHYMIDFASIKNPLNAADFFKIAYPIIENLLAKGEIVFLIGGSGFYLKALLYGMYHSGTLSSADQMKSDELYQREGIHPFIEYLQKNDPDSFNHLHVNDHYRIRRAVEHMWVHQTPFSVAKKEFEKRKETNSKTSYQVPWEIFHCYLDIPKNEHNKIIHQRTKLIISQGLESEVRELLIQGYSGKERPLQSIGYKEMFQYIKGEYSSLDACMERISIATRQLAKAQRTWFKKELNKNCYNSLIDDNKIFSDVKSFLLA